MRIKKVEDTLSWAYQAGYVFAKPPIPTKYLPGREVTFTAAELAYLNRAYDQSTAGQW